MLSNPSNQRTTAARLSAAAAAVQPPVVNVPLEAPGHTRTHSAILLAQADAMDRETDQYPPEASEAIAARRLAAAKLRMEAQGMSPAEIKIRFAAELNKRAAVMMNEAVLSAGEIESAAAKAFEAEQQRQRQQVTDQVADLVDPTARLKAEQAARAKALAAPRQLSNAERWRRAEKLLGMPKAKILALASARRRQRAQRQEPVVNAIKLHNGPMLARRAEKPVSGSVPRLDQLQLSNGIIFQS